MEWILRIAVAGEFLGHGIFALQVKEGWFPYFEAIGMSPELAATILPWIGLMDIIMAIFVLVYPVRIFLLWMALWGFWTALLRPIAGQPVWDFVERWANWGAPLALFFFYGGFPKKAANWFKK